MFKIFAPSKKSAAQLAADIAECERIQADHDAYVEGMYAQGVYPHLAVPTER